ncbi:MAG: thiamine-phosphate kinase [Halothiobacillaceae bacterium]
MGEFELIRAFFHKSFDEAEAGVALGIGDDCALLLPTSGHHLAVTTDTLMVGVHFLEDDDAAGLGHKALAVNLSDLAAMGALPRWFTLNLSLPAVDEAWLAAFARGLLSLAQQHKVRLVGGDTVRGALSFSITALGERPASASKAMLRSGAKVGDWIAVSGVPGEAALGLAQRLGHLRLPENLAAQALARLHRPSPRVALGLALRDVASSAVDISDGLAQDLGHILAASGVGACIELANLPRSALIDAVPQQEAWNAQLAGGDDYELLFTLPPEALSCVNSLPEQVTLIGRIEAEAGLRLRRADGSFLVLEKEGHDHFV